MREVETLQVGDNSILDADPKIIESMKERLAEKRNTVRLVKFYDYDSIVQIEVFVNGKFVGYGMREIEKVKRMYDWTHNIVVPHLDDTQKADWRDYLRSIDTHPECGKHYDLPTWLTVEFKRSSKI